MSVTPSVRIVNCWLKSLAESNMPSVVVTPWEFENVIGLFNRTAEANILLVEVALMRSHNNAEFKCVNANMLARLAPGKNTG